MGFGEEGPSDSSAIPRGAMAAYYEERLSGERLVQCYALASPRIQRYLDSEIRFVVEQLGGSSGVLELGCGYGRALARVAPAVGILVGNDVSENSLHLARTYLSKAANCQVVRMDASRMGFRSGAFDGVFCIQNGISAFGTDQRRLAAEAVRVTREGGRVLFSSYSPRIWDARLAWFEAQSRAGLLGEIDRSRTGDGVIICKDGFRATTVDGAGFERLFAGLGRSVTTEEVDGSSLFGIVVK